MADHDMCEEIVRLLRLQRHDFINHLQVIHAMIQLGRTEKALAYIEDLSKDSGLIQDTLQLHVKAKNQCQQMVEGQEPGK